MAAALTQHGGAVAVKGVLLDQYPHLTSSHEALLGSAALWGALVGELVCGFAAGARAWPLPLVTHHSS